MIEVTALRKGVTFELERDVFKVLEYEHHKPGRGNAVIRIKARNLRTGSTLDKTFLSGERVQEAQLEYYDVQYLYTDTDFYYFMDLTTFEQFPIMAEVLSSHVKYLKEGLLAKLTFHKGTSLDIELPTNVDLIVVDANTAVRGDTATGVDKKATTETGLEVQVPGFVNKGDTIRIDTRTGNYVARVQ